MTPNLPSTHFYPVKHVCTDRRGTHFAPNMTCNALTLPQNAKQEYLFQYAITTIEG